MAMPMRIDLAHRLEFPGTNIITGVEWSPSGDALYVHAIDTWINPVEVVVYGWPEVGGGLLVLVAIVWVVWLIRVRRRRRRVGAPHCRKCNYDLSAHQPDGAQPWVSACPECGVATAQWKPILGRTMRRRMLAPTAAVGVMVLPYGAAWVFGLPRTGEWVHMIGWRSGSLAEFAETHHIGSLQWFERYNDHVIEIDPRTGETRRIVITRTDASWPIVSLSPSGRLMVFQNERRAHTRTASGEVLIGEVVDVASGRTVQELWGPPIEQDLQPYDVQAAVAFQGDDEFVLISGTDGVDDHLIRFEIATGRWQRMVSIPLHAGLTRLEPRHFVADRHHDPSAIVSVSGFHESYHLKKTAYFVFDVDGDEILLRRTRPAPKHDHKARPRALVFTRSSVWGDPDAVSPSGVPTVVPGGEAMWCANQADRWAMEIDLRDGATVDRVRVGPVWETLAIDSSGRMVAAAWDHRHIIRTLVIFDAESNMPIALLPYPQELVRPVPEFSQDGRRLATVGFVSRSGQLGPYVHQVMMYDLSEVVDRLDVAESSVSVQPP
ncbi:MAG: hypothetical protein AAGI30_05280 [Planctomycetota bacterium]